MSDQARREDQSKREKISIPRAIWGLLYRQRRQFRSLLITTILLVIFMIVPLALLLAYAINLVNLNLIISLVIAEVPIGVFLHYLLRQDRNPAFDAIARIEALERFGHLEVHTRHAWGSYYYPDLLYYVINTKTKKAYYVSNDLRVLVRSHLIKRVRYQKTKDFQSYFEDNGITLERKFPSMKDLGASFYAEDSSS